MLLLLLILMPVLGSIIAALMPANARNREAWLAGGIAFTGLLITAYLYTQINPGDLDAGGVVRYQLDWMPHYGLNFVLRMDGLAWMFSMLILGIGVLVVIYARYYMSPKDP